MDLLMLWEVLAQTPPPAAPDAARVQSIWDFVVKGGPVMIPIGLCSLVALTVIVERFVSLRRSKVIPPAFLPGLKALLAKGPAARSQALDYCKLDGSPVASVFAAGIKRLGEPTELMERHIDEAGQREVFKLRRYLRVLAVIGSISTLLGLLGTILGMIKAFETVAASGEALGRTELLAKGIYEAMITTAAGLLVAIPVVVCYHWISARIERLVAEIDALTVEFVEEFGSAAPVGGRRADGAPARHAAADVPAAPPTVDAAPQTPPGGTPLIPAVPAAAAATA